MLKRIGKYTAQAELLPVITAAASAVGKKEAEGPLGKEFDLVFEETSMGGQSWEKAEGEYQRAAAEFALKKAGITAAEVQMLFAGDLQNQCMASTFSVANLNTPFAGIYGACSTMALTLALSAVAIESGLADTAMALTSSHFCSAEKQFRMPLEYGGQRPPSAQWTATASGAAVVRSKGNGVKIKNIIFGRIRDLGITDPNNMGAAMAPAAAQTISDFLSDTGTVPEDYDLILTGDLGAVGSKLLIELLQKENNVDISRVHNDCGLMIYELDEQDVNSGGSGCGCSAAVVCSNIYPRIKSGELKKVLFVGTGALLSSISTLQGESVPGIAHGVLLVND